MRAHGNTARSRLRREYDEDKKVFINTPVKNWGEHYASEFRYLGLSWREEIVAKVKPAENKETYQAMPDGSIRSNQTVKEAVDAMARRRRTRG